MPVTRAQHRKEELRKMRTAQAVVLVEYFSEREHDWRGIYHPRHIKKIPQCLRDIAEDSVTLHHFAFNEETQEFGCFGWQWIDVVARICRDLQIKFTYSGAIGIGSSNERFGIASYAALLAYVQTLDST